jgi:hypothetical protein
MGTCAGIEPQTLSLNTYQDINGVTMLDEYGLESLVPYG